MIRRSRSLTRSAADDDRGFSLLEVLVATSILVVGVAALAQLLVLARSANARAQQTTAATVLAQQKIEDLVPAAAAGGLAASPQGTLTASIAGYCDFVDRTGRVLDGGPPAPVGSAYVRRWQVDPLPNSPRHTWILQVHVTGVRNAAASGARLPGDARVVSAVAEKGF